MHDPKSVIQAWLPHLLVLSMVIVGLGVFLRIMQPLIDPLVMAAAVALLFSNVLFGPLSRWCQKLPIQPRLQRLTAAIAATVCIIALAVLPVFLLVGSTIKSLGDGYRMAIGFLARDAETLERMETGIAVQLEQVHRLYPQLHLDQLNLAHQIMDGLSQASSVNASVLDFMRTGTGFIAQQIITIICLVWFFAEGPRIVRNILTYSPLSPAQQNNLIVAHRSLVLRLINGTFGTALAKGVLTACIIVGFHAINGQSLPLIPIALLAILVGILPVIGLTLVWLPVTLLMWTAGSPFLALAMGTTCLLTDVAISWGRHLLMPRLQDGGISWSFFLMLGIIGGLLQFQLKGLIIGPVTVVFVGTLFAFWLPLYGVGQHPAIEDTIDSKPDEDSENAIQSSDPTQ